MPETKERLRAPGGGRKPIYSMPMKAVNIPMTDEQREKMRRLGGSAWIRQQIDDAVEPTTAKEPGKSNSKP